MKNAGSPVSKLITAIFGGAFDPVHFGHIKPALELLSRPEIGEVRLLPCRVHPDKGEPCAAAGHRVRMLELIAHTPGLTVDQRELKCEGASCTVDTLLELRAEFGSEAALAFVLGEDTLTGLPQWKSASRLPALAHLVVLARSGGANFAPSLPWRRVETLPELAAHPAGCAYFMPNAQIPVSSSAIRARIAYGGQPRRLLPGTVWSYIRRNRLYDWKEAEAPPADPPRAQP